MNTLLIVLVYAVYALGQGILVNRFIVKDTTAPVLMVVICSIFAPVLSLIVVVGTFMDFIKFLATPKS